MIFLLLGYNDPAARGILGLMSARVPPKLSEDCRLRSSRSPRTVLEARGLHLSQRSRGKRWILDIIPRFCRFPIHVTIQKPWHLGSTVFQDTPCSWCRKRGILGVLFSKMPPVRENVASWENCFPRCQGFWSHPGKDAVLQQGTKLAKPGYNVLRYWIYKRDDLASGRAITNCNSFCVDCRDQTKITFPWILQSDCLVTPRAWQIFNWTCVFFS